MPRACSFGWREKAREASCSTAPLLCVEDLTLDRWTERETLWVRLGQAHARALGLAVGCLASWEDKAESSPSFLLWLSSASKNKNREEPALSSFSLTPKHLCSIQVRDRALVIDLESFKSISSLSSPSSSVVLILERN